MARQRAAALVRDPEFLAKIRAVYAGEPDVTFAEVWPSPIQPETTTVRDVPG